MDWLRILGSIIFIDLVLSGDNALVIGGVAAGIRPGLRWLAYVIGGGGAIIVRISLTYFFTILLHFPFLQALGAVILMIVTVRLLLQVETEETECAEDEEKPKTILQKPGFARYLPRNGMIVAILTILAADITTSLDNIIAIASLAKQDVFLLVVGLLLSILLLLIGSALIAKLIERLSWVMLLAAIVLTVTAAQMFLQDEQLLSVLHTPSIWWIMLVYAVAFAVILRPTYIWYCNHRNILYR